MLRWHANDVMFWGFHSHFGTQKILKNRAITTYITFHNCRQSTIIDTFIFIYIAYDTEKETYFGFFLF